MGTDQDWEKWGAKDPYFGVLSYDTFRKQGLNDESRQSFFKSGETHVGRVLDLIAEKFGTMPESGATLDFGCGVGRLAIPFARRSVRCVGVDVSASMLAEASKNARDAGIHNIEFVASDGELRGMSGKFSLVHTYIVLQHIAWHRGRHIVSRLAEAVEPGGFLVMQFLTSSSAPRALQALVRARYAIPPVNWIRNIIRGRKLFEPPMQLHIYDDEEINARLAGLGFFGVTRCADPSVGEFTSVLLLARRGSGTR